MSNALNEKLHREEYDVDNQSIQLREENEISDRWRTTHKRQQSVPESPINVQLDNEEIGRRNCLASLGKILKWNALIKRSPGHKTGTRKRLSSKERFNSPIKAIQKKGLSRCQRVVSRHWGIRRTLGGWKKSTTLKGRKVPDELSIPLSSEILVCDTSNAEILSFTSIPNAQCEGQLKLRKRRSLTGPSHCQFLVWELEVVENTLRLFGTDSIEESHDKTNEDLFTDVKGKKQSHRLWWEVVQGFRLAVKFHVFDDKKKMSEKYRRKAIEKEGKHLCQLCKIWEREMLLKGDKNSNGRIGHGGEIPWENGHNCPIPQYYWTLYGHLGHALINTTLCGISCYDDYSYQNVVAVGMELIDGIPFTSVVRDVRQQGITTIPRARLLVDIARRTVRSQRFVAGQLTSPCNPQNHSLPSETIHHSYSLINWDTKPGNVMLIIGKSAECFGLDLGLPHCPLSESGTRCSCPSRLVCRRAVIIDIGDSLPGSQFIFPALGPSRKCGTSITPSLKKPISDETLYSSQSLARFQGLCSKKESFLNIAAKVCKSDTCHIGLSHCNQDTKLEQSATTTDQSINHSATESSETPSSSQLLTSRSQLMSHTQNSSISQLMSHTQNSSISQLMSHTQNSSILQLMSQWHYPTESRTNPSGHVVCTAGFCSPECAILVFLLSSATRHLAFRQLWYSNKADVNQMLHALNARRRWIWDKWIAEGSIVIVDVGSAPVEPYLGGKSLSNLEAPATPTRRKSPDHSSEQRFLKYIQNDTISRTTTKSSSVSRGNNERWGVRFTERTIVFSMGLMIAQLWNGKGLLAAATKDLVYAIDSLCEWNDESIAKENEKILSDYDTIRESKHCTLLLSKTDVCESKLIVSNPLPQSYADDQIIEEKKCSLDELPVQFHLSTDKNNDHIVLHKTDRSDSGISAAHKSRGWSPKTVRKEGDIQKKRSMVLRQFMSSPRGTILAPSLSRVQNLSRTSSDSRFKGRNRFGWTYPSGQHAERCNRFRSGAISVESLDLNFYSGKKRLGIESILPSSGIFSDGLIGRKARWVLYGCLRFAPGDRFTLLQSEDQLNEFYHQLLIIELNEYQMYKFH